MKRPRNAAPAVIANEPGSSGGGGSGEGKEARKWEATMARDVVLGFAVATAMAVGCGLVANDGAKYVRLTAGDGCLSRWAEVGGQNHDRENVVCCLAEGGPSVCVAARSLLNPVLTSRAGAILLPLLGFAISVLWQLWAVPAAARPKAGACWAFRLRLYLGAIVVRTAVLYVMLNNMQRQLQDPEGDGCWYAPLRHRGRCSENFDFADHLVLAICQHVAPQIVETYAILVESRSTFGRALALLATLGVTAAALICAFQTTAYFHTPAENVVALLLSVAASALPLWRLLGSSEGRNRVATSALPAGQSWRSTESGER